MKVRVTHAYNKSGKIHGKWRSEHTDYFNVRHLSYEVNVLYIYQGLSHEPTIIPLSKSLDNFTYFEVKDED